MVHVGGSSYSHDGLSKYTYGPEHLQTDSATGPADADSKDEHTGTEWEGHFSVTYTVHTQNGIPTGEDSIGFDFRFRIPDTHSFDWTQDYTPTTLDGFFVGSHSEGSWNGDTGIGSFTMNVVPEPGTVIGLSMGLLTLLRLRKRS
jgi:hypothetical protein